MLTLHTGGESGYDIHIGKKLLSHVGEYMKAAPGMPKRAEKICILSDDNVFALYGETVRSSILDAGYKEVLDFVIPHGEGSKCLSVYGAFLEFLAENGVSRTDCLVALGGGVVGDLCGFAAATYLRGIAYVGLPTSLLAMVDSSVGAKTAIDLENGKNLCGAFWRPALVICDTSALETLPDLYFADGMAEVIKYGVLFDRELFDTISCNCWEFPREKVIARCIAHKIRVVEADEHERGERKLLNLGHTVGHAIEQISGYTVPHGHAVARGMVIVTQAAEDMGLCEAGTCEDICILFDCFNLSCDMEYDAEILTQAMLRDKKREGGSITWVMPRDIGTCELISYTLNESKELLAKGMKA